MQDNDIAKMVMLVNIEIHCLNKYQLCISHKECSLMRNFLSSKNIYRLPMGEKREMLEIRI